MHEECHISITGEKSSKNRSFISQHDAIAQLGENTDVNVGKTSLGST